MWIHIHLFNRYILNAYYEAGVLGTGYAAVNKTDTLLQLRIPLGGFAVVGFPQTPCREMHSLPFPALRCALCFRTWGISPQQWFSLFVLFSLFYQDEVEVQRSKINFLRALCQEVAKLNLDSRSADLD